MATEGTFYVNTDTGSDSYDGTSATFTGGSTGPKATLSGAEALISGTLTGAVIINCAGSAADTTAVVVTGLTNTNASYTYTIVGDATSGIWDESKYHLVVTATAANQIALRLSENYITIRNLQVRMIATGYSGCMALKIDTADTGTNEVIVDKCIIRGAESDQAAAYGLRADDADSVIIVRNSVLYGTTCTGTGYAVYAETSGVNLTLQNCTVSGSSSVGLRLSTGTTGTVTNCAIFNNADDVSVSGTLNLTYSAGDDAEFDSGTGNVGLDNSSTSWNAAFTDYANGDFSVKDAGSVLYDAGTTIAAVTTDIAGISRPQGSAYDIGAFELEVATSQFARPAADRTDGNWLNSAGTPDNVDLFSYIDETSYSDSDYIKSGESPSSDTCVIDLSSIATPQAGTVTLRVRAKHT